MFPLHLEFITSSVYLAKDRLRCHPPHKGLPSTSECLNYQFLLTFLSISNSSPPQYISQSAVLDAALLTKDPLQQASVMKRLTFFFSRSRDDAFRRKTELPFLLQRRPQFAYVIKNVFLIRLD
ncbi:hypothetical protein CEXT_343231 [Caerostris extrusa]|uniref:Uncharacterized protein n=1 Tax=Caerostris extrusa TaxID=172846 RepID=A0AAV4RHK2_CAEEX|nr:hypothetical protein CEXT_343231 [Caerostris extrusa]